VSSYAACGDVRQALGVYVLGAIEAADHVLVERHLASCPPCTEELAGLAGLPALLEKVPPSEAAELAMQGPGDSRPPDPMLGSLLSRAARARRRRLATISVAAGAAVIAISGTMAYLRSRPRLHHLLRPEEPGRGSPPDTRTASSASPQSRC
jgi:anti-sigma factor RsiW